jgi:chorismate synthase
MNSFGTLFKMSIFGESHGPVVGVVVDGCPAGIPIDAQDFVEDLNRRKPGAKGSTSRIEGDEPRILSGIYQGKSTGAPITIQFENNNTRSEDYDAIKNIPRPGHADFVLHEKFTGFNDPRGGGHSSGRLTLGLVAAGVLAKKILMPAHVKATLIEAGGQTDINAAIETAIHNQDSIGGIVECRVSHLPLGLGEPFFNSVESLISHIIFAIPAIKGIEFGSGFNAARMTGSLHNDAISNRSGLTTTNHAGGINGGISNGNEVVFRIAVKPTSSTPQTQESWNRASNAIENFVVKGRHDLCIALRVPVIAEAAAAIALADLYLQNAAYNVKQA